jgi:transposase
MKNGKHEAATVAATGIEAMPRTEIVSDRRRTHSAAFRADVVSAAMVPGARIQEIAERHGICRSLIYRWRRAAGSPAVEAPVMRLFPVRITASDEVAPPSSPSSGAGAARRTGSIEIEIGSDVRVRVDESVSLVTLRRVMSVLRG